MPPIFYIEVRNKAQDFSNQTPLGLTRSIVTRYYTEFNGNPETVLEKLNKPEWNNFETTKIRSIGLKPRSISIDPGDWDRRIDWREEWEEFDEAEIPHENILGLDLYNVRKVTELGADRVSEIMLSSQVWGTEVEKAMYLQKLGKKHPVTTTTGKVVGEVSYSDLYEQILDNKNITELSLQYSKDTNTTAVSIKTEDSSDA
jgi:hypothetical protein